MESGYHTVVHHSISDEDENKLQKVDNDYDDVRTRGLGTIVPE